jgi:hypothetical protein
MLAEDRQELARELEEFGFRETDDPDEADRRNYYKVERWDSTEQHVFQLLHASNDVGRAQAIFASETKRRPRGRYLLRQGACPFRLGQGVKNAWVSRAGAGLRPGALGRNHFPGGRKLTAFSAALSMSSAVRRTIVLLAIAPLWFAASDTAAADTSSGTSNIIKASTLPNAK